MTIDTAFTHFPSLNTDRLLLILYVRINEMTELEPQTGF